MCDCVIIVVQFGCPGILSKKATGVFSDLSFMSEHASQGSGKIPLSRESVKVQGGRAGGAVHPPASGP